MDSEANRRAWLITLVVLSPLIWALPSTPVAAAESPDGVSSEVVAKVTASVGLVRSTGRVGSGWIAAEDTVITNYHVARVSSGDIYMDFSDGERVECYSAVADREMDLAVLRCDTRSREPVPLDTAIPGERVPVGIVGYPEGVGPTESHGVITGRRVVTRHIKTVEFTAEIHPGSSGSPVFDAAGKVRAVATFGGGPHGGGLGVPISQLVPLLDRAEGYPATKEAAEWRLRTRRSVLVGAPTLLIAWFFARRYGRNRPFVVAIRWTVIMVVVTLLLTQVLFAAHGPASFI